MKRFDFNLGKLLEFRKYREREKEMVLMEKAGNCARLDSRLMEIARNKHGAMKDRGEGGRTIYDFRAAELFILRMEQDRNRTEKALAAAEAERENARILYVEAKKNRTVIDKLRERQETEYYRTERAKEQFALDDMANARFGR